MFNFCKPVSSKKRFIPFRRLDEEFCFTLFDKAHAVLKNDWESVAKNRSLFLELPYLEIIEKCLYTHMVCRYVIVYHNAKPCGVIYYQITDFGAGTIGELFSGPAHIKPKRLNLFEKYIDSNKNEVLIRLFTCGNNLVSGEHGFVFDSSVNKSIAYEALLRITDIVSREDKLGGTISAILIKDFLQPPQPHTLFDNERYTEFFVEPNMVVDIPQNVNSLTAYTDLFSKKYRNRAKSIFKRFEGIVVRDLDLKATTSLNAELYALYEQVFNAAKFKINKLPLNYFAAAKSVFENQFRVKAFYLDNRMVAFASYFLTTGGHLEAHYIGLNYELNNQYELYQNLLYVLINEAIHNNCTKVNLGRTASEIKTTVGAKANDMCCFIKPQNTISRIIQKPFIAMLQPPTWIPRNPFKEESADKPVAKENA